MVVKISCYKNYIDSAILVPIPHQLMKERERGFNQSLLIAKSLNDSTIAKDLENLLVSKVYTQT